MTAPELTRYLGENYGQCAADHCSCRCSKPECLKCGSGPRGVWLGTGCPHWEPCGAANYAELAIAQKSLSETLRGRYSGKD